jgi:glutamine synthetase
MANGNGSRPPSPVPFGHDTFGTDAMQKTLPRPVYDRLLATIRDGRKLDPGIADEVAHGMKEWAVSRGATHFTHWFQPLNGQTAEKHDAFLTISGDGEPILRFSGSQLIQAEPDASSFPSGGMRSTFEARGYTAWDPTSPAFLVRHERGATLCIPSVFLSWKGEALDKKTPLLRSVREVSRAAMRVLALVGRPAARVYPTMGPEQEYFLVDERWYERRPDLQVAGRTLLGAPAAKGQQLEDHYFGSISERVVAFMEEVEQAAWALGIPVKTRHNEVAPHQYEIAPIFEDSNRAADHNQLLMDLLRRIARRRGLACLLHEKPFAGVNGSGKHNNWSLATDDGRNLLEPGQTPEENALFLFFVAAVLKAVHRRAALLRAGIANAGNDHRLGANEAPPAIVSVFLGDALTAIFEAVLAGKPAEVTPKTLMDLGMALPEIARDNTDRNRTSPFAFTGNKFEFRAVGSSQPIQMPNTFLNVAVAEALDDLAGRLEKRLGESKAADARVTALLAVAREAYREAKAVVFNGDNYSAAWVKEAEGRGLPHFRDTPAALQVYRDPDARRLLAERGILQPHEMDARYAVKIEQFCRQVEIECAALARMVDTGVLPAAFAHQEALARSVSEARRAGVVVAPQKKALDRYAADLKDCLARRAALSAAVASLDAPARGRAGHGPAGHGDPTKRARLLVDKVRPAASALRAACDRLESTTAAGLWPFPTYHQMLFQ